MTQPFLPFSKPTIDEPTIAAVADHKGLKHDTATLSNAELLAKLTTEFAAPEGLFFPDTCLRPTFPERPAQHLFASFDGCR